MPLIGVYLIGAFGGVATCAVAGAAALRRGLAAPVGLVTEGPDFVGIPLVPCSDLVFGGCDVRRSDSLQAARELSERSGLLPPSLLSAIREDLLAFSGRVGRGRLLNSGPAIEAMADGAPRVADLLAARAAIAEELRTFQRREGLASVVVVNLASTEPWREPGPTLRDAAALERAFEENRLEEVPASVLHACAAIEAGFPFVNFTPSTGSSAPAVDALARSRRVPHAGKDGKTGETLLKSVLAPMFLARSLKVLAWEGHNLLGNRDGDVLRHPENNLAKVKDKNDVLKMLGDPDLHSAVRIDYVPSLGDWKTAWDFIHFEGFLGTRMSLQFIWQGADSMLAAPLVLDLARLAALSHARGESGALRHLACFFKKPYGVDEHAFPRQVEMLQAYLEGVRRALAPMPPVEEGIAPRRGS